MKNTEFKFILFDDTTRYFYATNSKDATMRCLYYLLDKGLKIDNNSIKSIIDEHGNHYTYDFKLTVSRL